MLLKLQFFYKIIEKLKLKIQFNYIKTKNTISYEKNTDKPNETSASVNDSKHIIACVQ